MEFNKKIVLSALVAAMITFTGCGDSGGGGTTADTTKPVVTLVGASTVTVLQGATYTDAGATAIDDVDGVKTPTATSTVDTNTLGSYTYTWSATDAAGNVGTAVRTVIVQDEEIVYSTPTSTILSGDITTNTYLTKDKVWTIDGLVAVKNNASLKIDAGTTIIGKNGTGALASFMIIDKGSKIYAAGTATEPIIFTSEIAHNGGTAAVGQWGGLTIIGNAGNTQVGPYEVNPAFVAGTTDMADNSGILTYVHILNSGITMEVDKEINGLSMVGVGSGTKVENITVNKSDDDCIELWGGTVNLTNINLSECTDDNFDIDDGYSGTVKNLTIVASGTTNAGMEMSGTTAATFEDLSITMNASATEGVIYFKKDGIGGHFKNVVITNNLPDTYAYGTFLTTGTPNVANISFENVTIDGSFAGTQFVKSTLDARGYPLPTGTADATMKAIFDAQ